MAGLLELEDFREMFEVGADTPDARLRRALGAASRRIAAWVGDNYVSTDDDVISDLEFAEGNLAMHFLVANFNSAVRPGGMVKQERDEARNLLSYLSPQETAARAAEFFELAAELCRPYLISALDGTESAGLGIVALFDDEPVTQVHDIFHLPLCP